jgi:hypothetical protein
MQHKLVAFEEYFLEDGVCAICSCGWKSERVNSAESSTVEHQIHQREVAKDPESEDPSPFPTGVEA